MLKGCKNLNNNRSRKAVMPKTLNNSDDKDSRVSTQLTYDRDRALYIDIGIILNQPM